MREGLDGKVENFNQLPQEVQVTFNDNNDNNKYGQNINNNNNSGQMIMATRIIGSTHWTIFQISPLLSRALEGWLRSLLDWRPATRGLIQDFFQKYLIAKRDSSDPVIYFPL